jgi:hypothetical protein
MDLSLGPFHATAADAYCYYVALGRTRSVDALRIMAPADAPVGNFNSRMKTAFEKLKSAVGSSLHCV